MAIDQLNGTSSLFRPDGPRSPTPISLEFVVPFRWLLPVGWHSARAVDLFSAGIEDGAVGFALGLGVLLLGFGFSALFRVERGASSIRVTTKVVWESKYYLLSHR